MPDVTWREPGCSDHNQTVTQVGETPDFLTVALAPEFREDPYPYYAALRELEPVHRTPFGVYILTRHADAAAVVRDPRLSNDEANSELAQAMRATREDPTVVDQFDSVVMLFLDPPDHTRLRSLVTQAFTPRVVEGLRPRVEALVDELLDEVEAHDNGSMDVVADLAYPLPVVVICELLGVPPSDHETFAGWSRELSASIDPRPLRTVDQEARIGIAAQSFLEYMVTLVEERRRAPRDDLISALIAVEESGDRLSMEELLGTALFLLIAGHETTVNLIGNGTLALLRNPDQLARLRADSDLDKPAVEELLRYDSPVQLTQRITLDDYEVGGVTIPKGQNLVPLLGAANRDPAAFPEPDRLDLGRGDHRHLAFGGGAHFCLGAALARLEGAVALGRLARRFGEIELAGDPVRRSTFTLRGLERLPVRVRP